MIAPTGDQQIADILIGQPVRFISDDARRCFTRRRDHWQCAGDFAVPGRKRMQALATVAEPVAVITTVDNVQQPAGRAAVGVVVRVNGRPNACTNGTDAENGRRWE